MNPDQTVPKTTVIGAVRSGCILFTIHAIKVHKQMREQISIVVAGEKRFNTNKIYFVYFNILSSLGFIFSLQVICQSLRINKITKNNSVFLVTKIQNP